MRLTPKAVRAIERGDKTQHRVLVADPEPRRRANGTTYISQPFHPTVGQTLPVQPETRDQHTGEIKTEQVRVAVTDVTRSLLGDITPAGAKAEGHNTVAEFADQWMRVHTDSWPPKTEVLCKNCDGHTEYIDHEGQKVTCEECDLGVVLVDDNSPGAEQTLDRFDRKHAHHLVWVVTFELQQDVPRYLNKRAYLPPTTSLSEALEPLEILGPPRADWKHRAEQRRQAALKDRDGARLAGLDRLASDLEAEALRLATETDTEVTTLVRQVRQRVETIKRKVSDPTNDDRRAA